VIRVVGRPMSTFRPSLLLFASLSAIILPFVIQTNLRWVLLPFGILGTAGYFIEQSRRRKEAASKWGDAKEWCDAEFLAKAKRRMEGEFTRESIDRVGERWVNGVGEVKTLKGEKALVGVVSRGRHLVSAVQDADRDRETPLTLYVPTEMKIPEALAEHAHIVRI